MNDFIVHLIERGGYLGIVILMAMENVIPPVPSELIMGLSGVLVSRGVMHFWPLLIAGTIGTTIGNYFWFYVGHRFGYERLKPFVTRWGRWLTLDWQDIERASAFLRRHGQWVVFVLRFSPLFRTLISLPAGLAHMSHVRFLIFTAAGAAIWNALLISGGRWLGDMLADADRWIVWVGVALTAVTVSVYLWRLYHWKPRAER